MYHRFLIHSFTDGHLGYFQHLAIVTCAAMNIGVHRSALGCNSFELVFQDPEGIIPTVILQNKFFFVMKPLVNTIFT